VLVVRLVRADRVVARPLPVIQALAQREGALVKCSADGQKLSPDAETNAGLYRRERSRVKFRFGLRW
jgi:hypothetical protein